MDERLEPGTKQSQVIDLCHTSSSGDSPFLESTDGSIAEDSEGTFESQLLIDVETSLSSFTG